ncbi:uncharacterized protein LOC115731105 [Rhodamnia argentea]|uniref:Uncharacterized protein LOC115731105 n=1 Tax=Rhodamnia argentea TaxID=178133 RepID=A0A8B8N5A4_9MYRT|nr:uncharacterized protein LOC115731105 [Rhodamnia argentea]
MGSPRRVRLNNPFNLARMGHRSGVVYRNLVLFAGSFWVYFTSLFSTLFCVVNKFLRHEEDGIPHKKLNENPDTGGPIAAATHVQEDNNPICSGPVEAADDVAECEGSLFDKIAEESPPKFLSFKFPTFEEFTKDSASGDGSTFRGKNFLSESLSENNFREETEDLSSPVEDSSIDSRLDSFSDKFKWAFEFSSRKGTIKELEEPEFVHEEKSALAQENVNTENRARIKEGFLLQEEVLKELKSNLIDDKDASEKFQSLLEKDLLFSDTDSDSMSSSHDFSIMSRLLDSNSDDFFSERDLDEVREHQDANVADTEADDEDYESITEELEELEQSDKQSHDKDRESPTKLEEPKGIEGAEDKSHDKPRSEGPSESNGESSNCDLLWEHQDLIEQLRMELKKVRATGLPTILEDCESPKITEDLKPWKIDDKFQREEKMGELHKIYRSYRERMRKFDILNYQKMYALGFLRSKDPLKSLSSHKSTGPAITSLLSQSFKLCREKKSENDPTMKFMRELHSDLEIVYVGQLCLSWEFLNWQYVRALELWESDQYNLHWYNEVAGEFQQLQVLMQRFLENEQFEGPRVQYYVKTRCLLRNLLQVPVIREDNSKNRRMARLKGKGEYTVNSDDLIEILEESIRIFWRFIRADKDSSTAAQKDRHRGQPELQNPADLELLTQVQAVLQKKEKKLKDLLRGGNCVLRKFQKHQEETSDQVLCFFSQVDMKLVRRVLNMSRLTTDQLAWCSSKLSKIVFVHRRIHIEPSLLLFPC